MSLLGNYEDRGTVFIADNVLETNLSLGNNCVENMRSNFGQTHSKLKISERYLCITTFFTGLVFKKTRYINNQQTQSSLLHIHKHVQLLYEKPKKYISEQERIASWRQFQGSILPVVVHTQLQTRKGRSPVAKLSFGMYNNCIHLVVFELFDEEDR